MKKVIDQLNDDFRKIKWLLILMSHDKRKSQKQQPPPKKESSSSGKKIIKCFRWWNAFGD